MNSTALNHSSWSTLTKSLHWLLALTFLFEVPAGFLMSYTFGPSFKDAQILKLHVLASQVHHTIGFLVLAAGAIWLLQRWRRPRPPLPATMPVHERWLAYGAHGALLALILLVPWSGWTALSALEDSPTYGLTHIWFFGTDRLLPRIWEPLAATNPAGYSRFASLHRLFLMVGGCILAVHIGSALWHHWVRRDNILRRMWPLG